MIIISTIFVNVLDADIISITRIIDVLKQPIKQGNWFIFDIDDVIIVPDRHDISYHFVEKNFPLVWRTIHDSGVSSFALTARQDSDPELWRFFKKNGISFTFRSIIPAQQFSAQNTSFKDGVVFSYATPKGNTLMEFIDKLGNDRVPQAIYFIDDRLYNCQSVQQACDERGIRCTCFHYCYHVAHRSLSIDLVKDSVTFDDCEGTEHNSKAVVESVLTQGDDYFLLNALKRITPNLIANNVFYHEHAKWLDELAQTIVRCQSKPYAESPEDPRHPFNCFDRQDAREILGPLFLAMGYGELSDEVIDHLFPEKVSFLEQKLLRHALDEKYFGKMSVKRYVYTIAQQIYDLVKGNILLVLGQTPTYLAEMVKEIDAFMVMNGEQKTSIVNVPFSGRPDSALVQQGAFWSYNDRFNNIVNKRRENVFRTVLAERQFSPQALEQKKDKKVFILDRSRGPSTASFLCLIERWFLEEQLTMPTVTLLSMLHETKLFFDVADQKTFADAMPPVIFLGMDDAICLAFDVDVPDRLRMTPYFPSISWRESYQELFDCYPTPAAAQLATDYRRYARQAMLGFTRDGQDNDAEENNESWALLVDDSTKMMSEELLWRSHGTLRQKGIRGI